MPDVEAVSFRLLRPRQFLVNFRARVTASLVEKGMTQEDADFVIGSLGDGELLKWLILHGPDILAFIKMILDLFKE